MYVEDQSPGVQGNEKVHQHKGARVWDAHGSYRARVTQGVTIVALIFFIPFTIYSLRLHLYELFYGGAYIVSLLTVITYLIANNRDHEPLTMYALLPGCIIFMVFAFYVNGYIASIGCFPSVIAFYCILCRRKAETAGILILSVAAPMMWFTLEAFESVALTASLSVVILFASILLREIELQYSHLNHQINHDPMTGLLNRTSLNDKIESAIGSFHRESIPSSLIAVDLDHFKRVNDVFGHDTGDFVLCEVARLMKQNISTEHAVFRMGGEEFLILLNHNEEIDARTHAESLRQMISETSILPDFSITVSIGVASLRSSDSGDSWRQRSDNLLYMAKINGRNRVASEADVGPRKKLEHKSNDSATQVLFSS